MMTEPIETYILKTKHNFRIASAVGEAWPNARERMVAGFLDRLEARLKRRLKGYEFSRWGGRFFEDAYPGYSLFKSMWNNYAVGIECHEYGGQMLFGVIREKPRRGREPRS